MNFFSQIFSNKVLGISMFACFLAQFIKIFTGKEKFIQFSRLFTSGGMPSSHSSFVTSLATLVGIERGFNSTDFAIVTVFALIIMYDASGVRRAVGKQATILNQILDDFHHKKHIEQKRLKELGIPVEMTRTEDISLPKDERIEKVQSFGLDPNTILVSNHINSGGGDSHCVTKYV